MSDKKVVAIIPAAGKGTRLAPFPCAKELFPVGFQDFDVNGEIQPRPKVISQYIIDHVVSAGASDVFLILGDGKFDVMSYYGDGHRFGTRMNYLYQERLKGMPFAIDLAYQWARDSDVLFGMPDTIIRPENAFQKAMQQHRDTDSDLTLGLFPTDTPQKFGMVEIDDSNRVLSTIDKPRSTHLKYMWGFCCWSAAFTQLLHDFCVENSAAAGELVLGDVFDLALEKGMSVNAACFDDGEYIDIGTAPELSYALGKHLIQAQSSPARLKSA